MPFINFIMLWSIIIFSSHTESLGSAPSTPVVGDPPPPPSVELTSEEVAGMLREASERTLPLAPPLDLHWDLLCDSHTYQVGRG